MLESPALVVIALETATTMYPGQHDQPATHLAFSTITRSRIEESDLFFQANFSEAMYINHNAAV